MKERQLLKEVAIYLEGIKEGKGHIHPLGSIHIAAIWKVIEDMNRK